VLRLTKDQQKTFLGKRGVKSQQQSQPSSVLVISNIVVVDHLKHREDYYAIEDDIFDEC